MSLDPYFPDEYGEDRKMKKNRSNPLPIYGNPIAEENELITELEEKTTRLFSLVRRLDPNESICDDTKCSSKEIEHDNLIRRNSNSSKCLSNYKENVAYQERNETRIEPSVTTSFRLPQNVSYNNFEEFLFEE